MAKRNTELKSFVDKCETLGWDVRTTRHGWLVTVPADVAQACGGPRTVRIGGTGDYRAVRNARGDLNRAGFCTAWAAHEAARKSAARAAIEADRAPHQQS